MSGDFQCTHCGKRYGFAPGRCHNCSENTVRYLPAQSRHTSAAPPAATRTSTATSSAGSGLLGFVMLLIVLGIIFG